MMRVDVVVPCYNYGHFLGRCLDSVLSQEGVDVRVLVIDDCSTDDSADVADRLAAADSRIEVHRHAVNRGHIATYNEGLLDWATGDLVVLLSADDLLAPGALGRAAAIMEADPSVGMVYGWAPYFEDHDALPRVRRSKASTTRWRGQDWIEGICRTAVNVISSPEVVVRTSIQQRVGGYRPELPHAGDLEMWMRIAAVSDIAYVKGPPQAYYRVHSQSMQRTTFAASIDDLAQRSEVFSQFFERNGSLVKDAERLHRLADRALAGEALWRACRAYDRDDLDHVPVESLVDFAMSTYPDATTLSEHRALLRRRRLGPTWCRRTQVFILPAIARRLRYMYRFERWKRRGVV
jgi:glycosyltransferase involved in cell wall biosynthesis